MRTFFLTQFKPRVLAAGATISVLALAVIAQQRNVGPATAAGEIGVAFDTPTTSSPIALDANKNLLWVVNPDDDSVSVIGNLDGAPSVLAKVSVGDEPQSVALDTDGSPNSYHAYIANAADNTVTVVTVENSSANSVQLNANKKTLVTGAEPWNVATSPDGARVFVANSVQDSITVIRTDTQTIVGHVDLRDSACNDPDRARHFQPRGLAITQNSARLYVTRFLSFVKPGGVQADDFGKEGVVCMLDIPSGAANLPTVNSAIKLAPQVTGFKIDKDKDGVADDTSAYPNQMQSIVIRGDQAYLPNIATSAGGPLRFNVDTQAFVNVIDGVGGAPSDAGFAKGINLHLGARIPETGKTRLFFSNPWAIAFTNQSGAGNAYVVSSGSDLLVKLNIDAAGKLDFTGGVSTTRYIDLNDPASAATSGVNAGKNPLGIAIRGTKAYVMNYVSRNVSVVDLATDAVSAVVKTTDQPIQGSQDEQLHVGKEIFFASRGHFARPPNTTVSTSDRLSSEGWQNCASCHFAGWTDGNIWSFNAGPRKSISLNGTWSPHNPDDQRVLNYSAIFDEVQDFELNIRNVSGPGPLNPPVNGSAFNVNQGLIISDSGDINFAPGVVNSFARPNAGRPQHKVRIAGSNTEWPALDAMKEWVRFGVRTPNGALTTSELTGGGGLNAADVAAGRRLFFKAGCANCHGGTKWSNSNKDFASPPAAADLSTEAPLTNTVGAQFINRFLSDIKSFELGTAANPIGANIGAPEKSESGLNALGKDHNGDGKGNGYNIPSLLGIWHLPPYYHNGACETLACVLSNENHRKSGLKPGASDPLAGPGERAKLEAWLKTLDAETPFPTDLNVRSHDIHINPTAAFTGQAITVSANVNLFGTKADLTNVLEDLGVAAIKVRFQFDKGAPSTVDVDVPASAFAQNFGIAVASAQWTAPANAGRARVTVTIDPDNAIFESNKANNSAARNIRVRTTPPDKTGPVVANTRISDDATFNDADLLTTSPNVRIRFEASDPANAPEPSSGAKDYCLVTYTYDVVQRRWVESPCVFKALPAAVSPNTFIVDATLQAKQGVAYAFVWVRDGAGNISAQPGFDVITFIDSAPKTLNRNDVLVLRLPLDAGQNLNITVTPEFGDVDVAVFDDFTNPNAARIALSANNGTTAETVTVSGAGRRQVEIRAVVNSRFTISVTPAAGLTQAASDDVADIAAQTDASAPLVAGPPARAAVDDDASGQNVYLPLTAR
jgi:YVTN family beta-propeller protein